PQQQMELYAMLEQQSRMMAQMFTPQQQQMLMQNGGQASMLNGGMGNVFAQQQQSGRSLFDRVQANPQSHHASNARKGPQASGSKQNVPPPNNTPVTSAMDVEL